MLSTLFLLSGLNEAQASPSPIGETPFLLSPAGVDYLGWLTPNQCALNARCDVVVVDPRTGQLYLEQSDDLVGTRVYHDRTWGLSHRVEYELQESLVQSVQDFWTVSISYKYEGRNLVQVDWSDGRRIEVEYDRRDRVVTMSDANQRRLDFVWGRDGHHRMFDEAEDQQDLTVRLAELLKTKSEEYNQCEKRMESLIQKLQGDRSKRISSKQQQNSNILALVQLFQEEEERKVMIKIAEMQKQVAREEADNLESMPDWKARVLGISKEDVI